MSHLGAQIDERDTKIDEFMGHLWAIFMTQQDGLTLGPDFAENGDKKMGEGTPIGLPLQTVPVFPVPSPIPLPLQTVPVFPVPSPIGLHYKFPVSRTLFLSLFPVLSLAADELKVHVSL